jgi:hypothetical protein
VLPAKETGVGGRSSGVDDEEKGGVNSGVVSHEMVGSEGCMDRRRSGVVVACMEPSVEVEEFDTGDLDLNIPPCFHFGLQLRRAQPLEETKGVSSGSPSNALLDSVKVSCVMILSREPGRFLLATANKHGS